MMIPARRAHPILLFGFLALAMITAEFAIVHSSAFASSPRLLSLAVTADLALILPALYYLLGVRRGRLPVVTIAPVVLLAAGLASFLLPPEQHGWLEIVHYLTIPMEGVLLACTIVRIRRARRTYQGGADDDMLNRLRHVLAAITGTGWIAEVLAHEFAMWYYALGSWRVRGAGLARDGAFWYHRRIAYGAVVGAMAVATIVETVVVHIVVEHHSGVIAWGLTLSSLYLVLLLLADYRASLLRPILLREEYLLLRSGIRRSALIPLNDIVNVVAVRGRRMHGERKGLVNFALMGQPRLILKLARPAEVSGFLGRRTRARAIGIAVDNEREFVERLGAAMEARAVVSER
ncbi:MAG TPA: hypothetical protein VHI13_20785 [Candidatus Kapabacteria bacterium]|nr:hypothetical protein [Candidatus Kapabacteria bacterium]